MADQSILREYLISLGFRVDATQQKKFTNNLEGLDKKAVGAGKAILGVAAAAQAMVGIFSAQMEKMYYASRRIGTTVGNLQALKYGASQIGISGEHMQGALEGIARSMRSNPGLVGLVQSFGIKVQGRDMSDVATDFIKTLNKMPSYVAERYAGLFGIDPDTLFMMREGMAEMEKAAAIRKQTAADLGIDTEKAALAGKEYAQSWREIMMTVDLVKDALSIALLPVMKEIASVTKAVLGDWINIIQHSTASSFWKDFKAGLGFTGDRVEMSPEMKRRANANDPNFKLMPGQEELPWNKKATTQANTATAQQAAPAAVAASGGTGSAAGLFASLERKYNLPPGLLDKVWARESGRGRHMLSPAGAKGHMGFMDPTAAAYGVTDPNNLAQSAEGSAHMWADLLKQYNGDLRQAAAAYNFGSGNMKRANLGGKAYPQETRDYMDYMAGTGGVQQTVNINVTGAGNAQATADAIAMAQRQVNADLVRKLKPRVY